jgi:ribosomal protein S18 acetylase RimI-like enzyme
MDGQALVDLQLELECKRVVAGNTIVPIPCANPDGIPRCLVSHVGDDYGVYYRHDLPPAIRAELAGLSPERLFIDSELVKRLLASDAPCQSVWTGASYVFPATLDPGLWPNAVRLDDGEHADLLARFEGGATIGERLVYGVIADGEIAAACEASRENDRAAEAWVRTAPAYRRRGYARQVTAAWAAAMQRHGKVPFYSHALDNLASAGVARSLGLLRFVSAVAYE